MSPPTMILQGKYYHPLLQMRKPNHEGVKFKAKDEKREVGRIWEKCMDSRAKKRGFVE